MGRSRGRIRGKRGVIERKEEEQKFWEEVGFEEKGKGDRLRREEAITSISVFVALSHASALMQVVDGERWSRVIT